MFSFNKSYEKPSPRKSVYKLLHCFPNYIVVIIVISCTYSLYTGNISLLFCEQSTGSRLFRQNRSSLVRVRESLWFVSCVCRLVSISRCICSHLHFCVWTLLQMQGCLCLCIIFMVIAHYCAQVLSVCNIALEQKVLIEQLLL